MKKLIVLGLAASLFLVSSAAGQKKPLKKAFTNTGFFDGIQMTSKESGDYGGISVYLTESDGETFALVTLAEGMPAIPILVPATISGKDMRTVEFTYASPSYDGDLELKGTITASSLKLDGYGTTRVLPRKCAPVYSSITVGKESGDYGGMEVFVSDWGGTWYALVTTAEGVLKRPMLVPAKVTGKGFDKVEFTLSGANGDRRFRGTLARKAGRLTLTEGGTTHVLKAKCYQ